MASTSKDIPVRRDEDIWCLSDSDIALIKTEFNEKLHEYFLTTRNSEECSLKSENCLDTLILMIKKEEEKSRQDSSYIPNYLEKYKIVERQDGKERLLLKGEDGKFRVLLPWEENFDIFWETHLKYCHTTTETLKHILQNDYIVDDFAVQNIREVCYTCSGVKKPYYRLALDILTMSGSPDFAFTDIMTCQDMLTGFIHLRPLSVDNKESEISVELLRIFMDFGPPKEVVISSKIFEVALDQIKHLTTFAPISIAITKVTPDLDTLIRLRNRITIWMKKNNFENWGIACYAVQLHLNNANKGIKKKSPYANVFKNIESRVMEALPEMDVRTDEDVSTASPADVIDTSEFGLKSAEPASSSKSSSKEEEVQLICVETFAGTETEFKATSYDELVQFEDNDPLAIDDIFS